MDDDKRYAQISMRLVLVWSANKGQYVWVEPGTGDEISLRPASSLSLCEALDVTRSDGIHLIAPKGCILWVRKPKKSVEYVFFEGCNRQVLTQQLPPLLKVTVKSVGLDVPEHAPKKVKKKYFVLGGHRFRC